MLNGEDIRELQSIPLKEIEEAVDIVKEFAIKTPLIKLKNNSNTNPSIYLKLESLQPTGAFKLRGACNAVVHIDPSETSKGVYTTSTGNFAQGMTYAASKKGIGCTVICPETAPETKVKAAKELGATIKSIKREDFWNAIFTKKYEYPGTYIHPCCNRHVIAGNGTIGLELLDQLDDFDAVVIPFGGGGLACGIASAVKARRPNVKIFACEVEGVSPLTESIKAGKPVILKNHRYSFVDGMSGIAVLEDMWKMTRNLVDDVFVVSEEEICSALKQLLYNDKLLVEGAAAATLATVLKYKKVFTDFNRVVCIMSGGNLGKEKLVEILQDNNI